VVIQKRTNEERRKEMTEKEKENEELFSGCCSLIFFVAVLCFLYWGLDYLVSTFTDRPASASQIEDVRRWSKESEEVKEEAKKYMEDGKITKEEMFYLEIKYDEVKHEKLVKKLKEEL